MVILILVDDKVVINEGIKIVESVNCSVFLDHVPFVMVRTLIVLKLRAFDSRLHALTVGISFSHVLPEKP